MKVQIEFGILQNLCKYCYSEDFNNDDVPKCFHPHTIKRLHGCSCGECNVDDCPFCIEEVDE